MKNILSMRSFFNCYNKNMQNEVHEKFMTLAIEEAKVAKANGDWPFGAIVVKDGIVIGKGHVKDKTGGDVTDHAEVDAVRDACKYLNSNDLSDSSIYCTNEPCLMCSATIFQANIGKVFIGASRDDLSHILRVRKLRIENIADDTSHQIEINRGILKDKVLELFKDIKK
jgi:tRNA(adenine34) deaminase